MIDSIYGNSSYMLYGIEERPCPAVKMQCGVVCIFWKAKVSFTIVGEDCIKFLNGVFGFHVICPHCGAIRKYRQQIGLKCFNDEIEGIDRKNRFAMRTVALLVITFT